MGYVKRPPFKFPQKGSRPLFPALPLIGPARSFPKICLGPRFAA